ncbi:ABC1 kinase family protein [Effusibacillus consociatus]|uniref:ABC1 kinase family protein n=1 Tax=Effusibacillus consociatus TaxID=1117041 RepID=A0ABV9Q0T6_9BACL
MYGLQEQKPAIRTSLDKKEKERSKITKASRFRTIVSVLGKHGLLHLFGSRTNMREVGKRMRMAFEELGPTFIKLGQVLVTRQELLPPEITEELSTLLDEVPPIAFQHIQAILSEELPAGIATFEWIDPEPLGSASLAQVYRAKLRGGKECAVKVVRPNVDRLFQTDIAVIRKLVKLVQQILPRSLQASVNLPDLINDYYSSSLSELNMENEASAMEDHRKVAEEFETLHIPEVYLVTKKVLVQEFVDGWSLKEFPVDFFSFEERLLRMTDLAHYYIKTFLNGYYHGDPHGSNILVDKNTKKCVLIDFGMTGRMDSLHTEALFRMLMHIRVNQAEDAVECVMDVLDQTIYTDPVKLKDQMRSMMIQYVNSNQASIYNWGNLTMSIITIGMKNYCKIPSGLALWAKGFSAAEGTARWLCPEISFHSVVETADVNIIKNWTSRRFNYRPNASLLTETYKLLGTFPRRMNKILERLAWNHMKFTVETKISDSSIDVVNKMVNRISLTGLAGAFFIGGSILQAFAVGRVSSTLVPFFADAALVVSGVITVYLLWRILRSKRA